MSDLSKLDQLRQVLRPLADQFTMQVATTVMAFVQESVRREVQAVLDGAHHAGPAAPEPTLAVAVIETTIAPATPKVAVKKPVSAKPKAVVKVAAKKQPKAGKKPGSEPCSKKGCAGTWYRPSGRDRKLCYQHFIEAGGKAPPGKHSKKK
jgi:hypothetical protein